MMKFFELLRTNFTKISVVVACLALLLAAIYLLRTVETVKPAPQDIYLNNEQSGYKIVIFSGQLTVDYFDHDPQPLIRFAHDNHYRIAFNANYFSGTYQKAIPAGLLQISGQQISPAGVDRQLQYMLIYNHQDQTLKFLPQSQFDRKQFQGTEFTIMQTGPLVIDQNTIAEEAINDSLNGQGKYKRTLIGFTDQGRIFVVVTDKSFTLADLGREILQLPEFAQEKISLINLDGGPSTALYVADHPEMNFNEQKELPLVIGVK